MDGNALHIASLALLLDAERKARSMPAETVAERFRLSQLFQPHRAEAYTSLSRALVLGRPDAIAPLRESAMAKLTQEAGLTATRAGPLLLVCESQPFESDLDSLHDQVLLRLLIGATRIGLQGWVLRTRLQPRPLQALLRQLPGKPASIVAVDMDDSSSLQILRESAPVVRLGVRSNSMGPIPCVEYDSRLEASAIASFAAACKAEQIAFVSRMDRRAARRRIQAGDVAVLSALTAEAQNRQIAVPGNLTFWLEANQSLQAAGILPKLAKHVESRVLAVVSGAGLASELVEATGHGTGRVVCRHWSAEGAAGVPVIGPDLDQLALVVLARAIGQDKLPADAAVLVPPVWHRKR